MSAYLKVWKRGEMFFIDICSGIDSADSVEVFRNTCPKEVRYKLDNLKAITGFSAFIKGVDI
jgi:hypothetical protein